MVLEGTGRFFDVVGIACSGNGRSCKDHTVCGVLLYEGCIVSIRKVEVTIFGKRPEDALAVHLCEDAVDTCRVGFLKKYLLRHSKFYDGKLARIVEIYDTDKTDTSSQKKKFSYRNVGCARAEIMKWTNDNDESPQKTNDDKQASLKRGYDEEDTKDSKKFKN